MPDAENMSGFEAGIHALLHASKQNPRLLANDDHRDSIRSMFISDVATRLHSCQRFSADWFCSIRHRFEGIAVAIYLLEHHEPGQRLTRCLFPPHESDVFIKLLDAINGCDRSLLKFYKERVPCNCLDEVYGLFRRKSKTGICQGCGIRKKRRELLICTRSKDVSGQLTTPAHRNGGFSLNSLTYFAGIVLQQIVPRNILEKWRQETLLYHTGDPSVIAERLSCWKEKISVQDNFPETN